MWPSTTNYFACQFAAESINMFGKDVEMDFEAVLEAVTSFCADEERSIYEVQQEKDDKKLRDLYHAGLWAPHPEYYLKDVPLDERESSVFVDLKKSMDLIIHNGDQYIYKKTIHKGSGIPVNEREIVVIHYAAFVDFADEPVDVAYSRAMKRSLKLQ